MFTFLRFDDNNKLTSHNKNNHIVFHWHGTMAVYKRVDDYLYCFKVNRMPFSDQSCLSIGKGYFLAERPCYRYNTVLILWFNYLNQNESIRHTFRDL